jgi:hypothetical protein
MADVIASWSRHDPQEAVEWLVQQTDHPDMQARGMAMAMRRTTANSPTQALALMDQLEPGPVLDQATVGLVGHLADFAPQAAFTCASQIMDAALRPQHSAPGHHGNGSNRSPSSRLNVKGNQTPPETGRQDSPRCCQSTWGHLFPTLVSSQAQSKSPPQTVLPQ